MASEVNWRRIWRETISANRELCSSRSVGERAFQRLEEKYPNDGMVHYSRAEAYEYPGERDRAGRDYEEAERLFPAPHWKKVARLGVERIQTRSSSRSGADQWAVFHRIYQCPGVRDDIRADALAAVARFDGEPHVSAGSLRGCLETLIRLLDPRLPRDSDLKDCIDSLAPEEGVPARVHASMHTIRDLGNKGMHLGTGGRGVKFEPILSAFALVLEWADSLLSERRS